MQQKLRGCRASKNREEVLKVLEHQSCPVTAEEIYNLVKEEIPTVSLSTIYRIIEKLISLEIVNKATTLDDNRARYELVRETHKHYMICTKCRKMIPIDCCPIEEFENKVAVETGFNITGHKFELYGECKACAEKSKKA